MIILGIDPGTRIIGYGIVSTEPKTKVITYGVIKTQDGLTKNSKVDATTLSTRLLRSYQQILKSSRNSSPDQMAIETVFFSMDAQATDQNRRGTRVALLAAPRPATPVYEYSRPRVQRKASPATRG